MTGVMLKNNIYPISHSYKPLTIFQSLCSYILSTLFHSYQACIKANMLYLSGNGTTELPSIIPCAEAEWQTLKSQNILCAEAELRNLKSQYIPSREAELRHRVT